MNRWFVKKKRISLISIFIGMLISIFILTSLWMVFYTSISEILYKEPSHFGLPDMQHPKDNLPTKEKVILGRKLFMDRRLSHNNTISCAMCHVPEQAFSSNELATAVGIEGRTNRRNSPTILNVGYYETLFHDGREFTLENQVIGPMVSFNEMGNPSIGYVIEKIRNLKDYQGMFEKAFGGEVTLERMSQAIAAYERTLVSGGSKFDQWYYAKDINALNNIEIRGFNIFTGKGKCVACHSINEKVAIFTDQSFHNTGIGWARNNKVIHKVYESKTFPVTLAPGVVVQVEQGRLDAASEEPQNDVGRFEITEDPKDRWAYKTPSLRNIALTAPYMHDGSLTTLDQVVEFYNKGGEDNPLKDPLLQPLGLTNEEKESLVVFLRALTGVNIKQLEDEARTSFSSVAD